MGSNKLGFWSIVLLGINGIIGSGIFLLPNKAVDLIGPASLLVMIFDMFLVLAITSLQGQRRRVHLRQGSLRRFYRL